MHHHPDSDNPHQHALPSSERDYRADHYPLYDAVFEHDACGTGLIANISGVPDHRVLQDALTALAHLAHRGALDAAAETSDGAGIMAGLPQQILADWLVEQGIHHDKGMHFGVGMCFLPQVEEAQAHIRGVMDAVFARRGLRVLGWRPVPVAMDVLGQRARRDCPQIEQVIIAVADDSDATERQLYFARREMEQRLADYQAQGFAIPSLSARTIVYKGLLTAGQVVEFYPDLADPRYTTAFALFHQRYSTNTFPSWRLAQPLRMLAHNGEINTVQGNRLRMGAREADIIQQHWPDEAAWLRPILQLGGSDSTSLDNAVEVLRHTEGDLLAAFAMLIPEAWEGRDDISASVRAFYAAHAPMLEPWDGPAALVFSDGRIVGARLDRNGLRPLRYAVTADGLLVVASEVGVLGDTGPEIVTKGRLGPGQMLAVDLQHGQLLTDCAIKEMIAAWKPYGEWVQRRQITIMPAASRNAAPVAGDLLPMQARFGYSHEDVELILRPMAAGDGEAVWSMGDDTPLAVLSRQPRPLAAFFKQRFAQVTNPPIDSLRERCVMSLTTYLGPRDTALTGGEPEQALLVLPGPVLDEATCEHVMRAACNAGWQPTTIACGYVASPGDTEAMVLSDALDTVAEQAVAAARADAGLIILSDRDLPADHAPIPMLLAVAGAHQALRCAGLRLRVGLLAVTGALCDTHQCALLLGYGANAVHPYLAMATARGFAGGRGMEAISPAEAQHHYRAALEKGLLKIMARMGLSVLENYQGAQLFEAIGLDAGLLQRYFPASPSVPGGFGLRDIHAQVCDHQAEAARLTQVPTEQRPHLTDRGYVRFRRSGEYHAANPLVVRALQRAALTGDPADYARYAELVQQRPPTAIRDHLALRSGEPLAIDEVESAQQIARRFVSSAMSVGSLSPEAHLTLTLGMNLLGGRSNTGEGGEDPDLFTGERDAISTNSRVKQIASGRFGVTAAYLANAEEIEIKMAQGSKPGEGGQIPARKVTAHIARLRHTIPGIPLISPPPHHDIYSIEDLAQLIFDLKQANPRAAIGVKLVATRGVGTIAAGVAKAHADYILISGHDGGTGSSPLSAIKHAGLPWEVGLAEAQQVLRLNGLRGRVRLRVDGGLKTGRDVVIAAMLGADEFAFGTAALIALGCDMARQCHLDTCPAGIATQRAELRRKFTGQAQHVANFFLALANEVRAILAACGLRSLEACIGRVDLLTTLPAAPKPGLDRAAILAPGPDDAPRRYTPCPIDVSSHSSSVPSPEARLLDDALPLLERGHGILLQARITNRDRAVGARLAGEIARRWGDGGLPGGSITCHYTGSAGQSFGAFCVPGMRLLLTGDANDYVGKGMTGGEIVVTPHQPGFDAHEHVIAGNTILYGATGGMLLLHGRAGERFAVRNSGAVAVAEGAGDHACEYMTGGAVVILGPTGRNFGAGMSGGVAYVFDPDHHFPARINGAALRWDRGLAAEDARDVATLLRHYVTLTTSRFAADLLADWATASANFWCVTSTAGDTAHRPLDAVVTRLAAVPRAVSA